MSVFLHSYFVDCGRLTLFSWTGVPTLQMASSSNRRSTDDFQKKILNTALELPSDDEIKEKLKNKREPAESNESEIDDSDSDVEGSMEQPIWDALFPNDKPYENTIEDLTRLLHRLPHRSSTRPHKPEQKALVDEDIGEEIVELNFERIRKIIKEKIEKKSRKVAEVGDCANKLGDLSL